jgi:hypothetical protein
MHVSARWCAFAVAGCLLAAPIAAGSSPGTATAVSSPRAAGAKRAALALAFRSDLQCGRLMGGPVMVTLPRQVHVPAVIAASSVLVGTRAARSVAVSGHVITIALPVPRGAICDSITMGLARIGFAHAAGLANPKSAGTYAVRMRHGGETFAAALEIS